MDWFINAFLAKCPLYVDYLFPKVYNMGESGKWRPETEDWRDRIMIGMNAAIRNNVLTLLKRNGKKQNDLAEALGVSKQVMSNMLAGSRMINAFELHGIADFFHVSMESLMKPPVDATDVNVVHAFMGKVGSDSARRSLEIADEMADMVLFYGRMRSNAEVLDQAWEAGHV